MEISGTTCVAWSNMSTASLGWLDDSSIPCLTWAYILRGIQPHTIAHECVAAFDYTELSKVLGVAYHAQSVASSPTDLGLPVERKRRYTVCWLMMGPE